MRCPEMEPLGKVGNARLHPLEQPVAEEEGKARTDGGQAELAEVRSFSIEHGRPNGVDERTQRIYQAVDTAPLAGDHREGIGNGCDEEADLQHQRERITEVTDVNDQSRQ